VERVRFSKDGTMLQLTAIDGRRATVVLPNDPDLVDILARNGVDISVSEGQFELGWWCAAVLCVVWPGRWRQAAGLRGAHSGGRLLDCAGLTHRSRVTPRPSAPAPNQP
jgi:hypothetical protein